MRQTLTLFYAQARRVFNRGSRQDATEGSQVPKEPIDLYRSQTVRSCETARKPAPMLDHDGLTLKMTVKFRVTQDSSRRDDDSRGPLMIDWA